LKTEHTPGPWRSDEPFVVATDPVGKHPDIYVAEVISSDEYDRYVLETETRLANARLIAAVPEMLAACRCALAELEGSYSREDWDDDNNPMALTIQELIAAIAKATGG